MDVSVNSTIIQVSSRKKGNQLLCWQSPIDGKDDLLDLLISRIQDPTLFQFTKQRFGDGTAASPDTSSAISPEKNENSRVPKKFDKKVLELVPFDVAPYKDLSVFTEIVKENGIELYRYAFFTVLYLHKFYFILSIRPLFFCKISKVLRSNVSHKCTGFIFFRMMIFESTFFLTAF